MWSWHNHLAQPILFFACHSWIYHILYNKGSLIMCHALFFWISVGITSKNRFQIQKNCAVKLAQGIFTIFLFRNISAPHNSLIEALESPYCVPHQICPNKWQGKQRFPKNLQKKLCCEVSTTNFQTNAVSWILYRFHPFTSH